MLEVKRLFTFFSFWKRPRTTRDGRPYLCWGLKLRGRDTHGCGFEVGSLGRGGISEAASLGEQRWRLSAGVLRLRPDSDRGSERPPYLGFMFLATLTAPALAAPTRVGVETQTRSGVMSRE